MLLSNRQLGSIDYRDSVIGNKRETEQRTNVRNGIGMNELREIKQLFSTRKHLKNVRSMIAAL